MTRLKLTGQDGHVFDAIWSPSTRMPEKAGVILLHEIFGLTDYVEDVSRFWSAQGFDVLTPALFDRAAPDLVVDYDTPDRGLEIVSTLSLNGVLSDIEACLSHLRQSHSKIGVLGYCWGGGLAYRAACELPLDGAACVYPTRLMAHADYRPNCPVLFQFAARDKHASQAVLQAMATAAPEAEQIIFQADHAFDRREANDADRETRQASRDRICEFFTRVLAC